MASFAPPPKRVWPEGEVVLIECENGDVLRVTAETALKMSRMLSHAGGLAVMNRLDQPPANSPGQGPLVQ